jgi:uncharacterized protein YqjF (DUF2071 family)
MGTRWNQLLNKLDHRPWAIPERAWSLTMCWRDLLFMHWPLPPHILARQLPPGLSLDTFDGAAWIGVVPFRMTDIGLRPIGTMPVSSFAELNVRTYVKHGDRSGVWFLSLDAASRLAVETARTWFHLPYFHASIRLQQRDDGWTEYACRRLDRRGRQALFHGRYRPVDSPRQAKSGTLDHWLTERYCFFAVDGRGRLSRTDVHHHPWPLQSAEAIVETNSMAHASDVALPASAPLLHFAMELDVIAWTPVLL